MSDIKHFSDFAERENILEGSKVKITEIVGKEIILTGYEIRGSKFRRKEDNERVMTVQFKILDEVHIFFTGSEILMKQLEKYKSFLPFKAIIKKIDKYFTLS